VNERYDRCIRHWDTVFSQEPCKTPEQQSTGNASFDRALEWVCAGTDGMLDFGCGNGTMLFLCALRGTRRHIGVDLSQQAIESARKRSKTMAGGTFSFFQGGVEQLERMDDDSVDAILLSNIVDNLYPDDALLLLNQCGWILRPEGKLLIKLNPHLSQQQIGDWDIRVIEGNLLDDGLLLWNNTTEAWREIFERYFRIAQFEEIYYPEYEQINRLFLLEK
jgi:ubiquinone/menaquinone biosynthesis C-methylase UbiE